MRSQRNDITIEDLLELAARVEAGELSPEDLGDPNLKGRKSARHYLKRNAVNDRAVSDTIQANAIPFSEFQQLGLYHEQGLFEEVVDFTSETMLLQPQVFSPLFGKMVAEILFANYISITRGSVPPTFLGLGAGKGFLDVDMINHITSPVFVMQDMSLLTATLSFADKSDFIITDRTQRAQQYLKDSLAPIIQERNLAERVQVMGLDATNFRLDKQPFGIVYSNELLDNMPVEPIVDTQGRLHKVMMIPYTTEEVAAEYLWDPDVNLEEFEGRALTKDGMLYLVEENKQAVKFCPVFIPLSDDEKLQAKVKSTKAVGRAIGQPDFGGIYPLQVGVKGLLQSARDSFDHGLVLFVDYTSFNQGAHNWNMAVNQYNGNYVFGEEDLDFQIDFEQVIEEGRKLGYHPLFFEQQDALLHQFSPLLNTFKRKDFEQWRTSTGYEVPDEQLEDACLHAYAFNLDQGIGQYYNFLILGF